MASSGKVMGRLIALDLVTGMSREIWFYDQEKNYGNQPC
jgi:hypothetical protein